jgi:hypothetical protein
MDLSVPHSRHKYRKTDATSCVNTSDTNQKYLDGTYVSLIQEQEGPQDWRHTTLETQYWNI